MATKIISNDDARRADRWDVPAIETSAADALSGARGGSAHLLTARQLDDLQRQVQQEAHQRGFEQGLTEGRAELAARVDRLSSLIDALAQPYKDLDESVEQELAGLAVVLASHILRREIEHDAGQLIAAVRDCIGILPSGVREVTVHVNPEDAALIRADLSSDGERAWQLEEDAALERGDLRVHSASSQVDGRVEPSPKEIVAAALGESQRSGDPA